MNLLAGCLGTSIADSMPRNKARATMMDLFVEDGDDISEVRNIAPTLDQKRGMRHYP